MDDLSMGAAKNPFRLVADFRPQHFLLHHIQWTLLSLLVITLLLAIAAPNTFGQAAEPSSITQIRACQEVVANGGFEADTTGNWTFGTTAAAGTVVTTAVHTGNNALRLGIPATNTNSRSESTAYQSITIPANVKSATLTYWERPGTTGDSNDYREIILLRSNFTVLRLVDRTTGSGNDTWTQRSFDISGDISDLAGSTVVLYFNVSNDGSGATLVSYLDDISLQLCDDSVPPTATPTATNTPPATPPTPTPTTASTPAPVRLQAGSAQTTGGTTTVTVPLDLVVLTDRVNVAVLSLDLQYNASLLKATNCATSQAMAPLLCNVSEPGRIQLAGVAAEGIRAARTLAEITFEIQQSVDRTTPLTIQLEVVGDVNGAAVSTDEQHGVITLTCAPEAEDCSGIQIYLPLVHR